ncbi:glycosyltransferase family 4 protein [Acidaminobacter sp. JC074]|uniref:glycosyltransferase family 4 protein n=1 Tax=Acidaminobacter sp. JC074 TaxID=2530199 RepID=UPI001F0D7AE7|nr:glycosyltransferase family 4 protein [Acidaminobacter sp. JC074]MCH4889727.1 glycosyltransferase family 4 protein [Acidaminobacter sp. JC074]
MKKMLFISNTSNAITNFTIPSIVAAKRLGYEVHLAANYSDFDGINDYGVIIHHLDIERNPFNFRNLKAYRQLKKVLEKNNFDMIHCNTPVGGVLGRFVGKKYGIRKIIYSAHGFHFYKGAPLINRSLYWVAEYYMAKMTDALITINQEDYEAGKKLNLKAGGKVFYIPGVGIDLDSYQTDENLRTSLGLSQDDTLLISMGDLIKRKNYEVAIKALDACQDPSIKYLICGTGPLEDSLKLLVSELGLSKQVFFLGFRRDVVALLNTADIFLFTSLQEGLPRSTMEAMTSGLPCIVSKIRGNTDLITQGGFLIDPMDISGFSEAIETLASNKSMMAFMSQFNKEAAKSFDVEVIKGKMYEIYKEVLE